uniref:Putative ovule protein n=1 Tax=Solanum chacoense TaxID=4108 RepID=A0A0V0H2T1_SOLCH
MLPYPDPEVSHKILSRYSLSQTSSLIDTTPFSDTTQHLLPTLSLLRNILRFSLLILNSIWQALSPYFLGL